MMSMKNKIENIEKLRVCEFGQKSLYRVGGVEVVVYEIATRMVKLGIDVTCINRSGDQSFGYEGAQGKPKEIEGVKIKYAPTINRKGFAAMTSSVFASFSAAFGNYNIVHVHAEGAAFMCWLPKLMGKKVIVTIHGLDHQRTKWGKLASWYIEIGERNATKYADEIIVLSKGVRDYFKKTYGRETNYIPNGVKKPTIREADIITKRWGLSKASYVLLLSRLVPEKGVKYLIKAFKNIDTEIKLVIAGGSSDSNEFLNEIRALAADDDRVILTGFVQAEVLDELYSNAYIYCLPSDLEGMPLSLLEAMSYGNCCLTSDIDECTEVVENKAFTFKKGDIEDLKEKLEFLISHEEEVTNHKVEASNYICSKYSWDDVVEKTLRLYR